MVLKNYYVHRTQFPLILAYAVTIDKVFAEGMAYVALSRVRSLAGLHLNCI